jgi:hypothetical protein
MVCVLMPLLLNRNVVLFGVLTGPRSNVPFFFSLLWFCIVMMSTCFPFAVLRWSANRNM